MRFLTRCACDERGATAVEYALMVGFIAIAIVLTVTSLGLTVADGYTPLIALFNRIVG